MTETGTVQANDHQFLLSGRDTDTTDVGAEGNLIWAGPGFITVLTGIAFGPVALAIDNSTTEPAIDDWDTVEETVIDTDTDLLVLTVDGEVATGYTPIPAGRYRVRAYARGRDADFDTTTTTPTEHYLLHITSATVADTSIASLREAPSSRQFPPKRLPEVDYQHFYAPGPDGSLAKFTIDSPEAKAVFALRDQWGGRPPTGRIAENLQYSSPASIIADLDRDLVDEIDALSEDRLRALARWCARRAFEHAGLTEFADFRAALDAAEHNTTPPADFLNESLTLHRLHTDPAIALTIEPGIAGATDFVPQYEALRPYMFAVSDLADIKVALEAVRFCLATYGRDYAALIRQLRTEFLYPS
ncbi:hypothetical protein ACFWVM_06305 [Nocardia fluminea]|uniref:hypothetical protein n=1 Tax=Nocardia fluminea TaxID=134984 RepID=UPI003653E7DD